jgi:hypothetical protein
MNRQLSELGDDDLVSNDSNDRIYVVEIKQNVNGENCVKEIGNFPYSGKLDIFMKAVDFAINADPNIDNIDTVIENIKDNIRTYGGRPRRRSKRKTNKGKKSHKTKSYK